MLIVWFQIKIISIGTENQLATFEVSCYQQTRYMVHLLLWRVVSSSSSFYANILKISEPQGCSRLLLNQISLIIYFSRETIIVLASTVSLICCLLNEVNTIITKTKIADAHPICVFFLQVTQIDTIRDLKESLFGVRK